MTLPERFALATFPTPLQRAPRLERALGGGEVWIKRDDLSGFGIAGNKARPLEFLLGDALSRRADVLVATGATGSTFCAAAAVAARVAGLDCALLHPGSEPSPPPVSIALSRAAGACLHFDAGLGRDDLDTAVQELADRLRAAGRRPYAVPRGGATPIGALGFALAAGELGDQCAERGLDGCTVVVPCGSGATQAGLLAGRARSPVPLRVVGASVSRPVGTARAGVLALARGCARLLNTPEPEELDLHVHDAVGAGFGRPSAADRDSAAIALETEGLLLDDTYTAKAVTLLRELARQPDEPLVFWHTGGIAGALRALGDQAPAREPA